MRIWCCATISYGDDLLIWYFHKKYHNSLRQTELGCDTDGGKGGLLKGRGTWRRRQGTCMGQWGGPEGAGVPREGGGAWRGWGRAAPIGGGGSRGGGTWRGVFLEVAEGGREGSAHRGSAPGP
ncbi:hypothetical protein NE237_004369 [Protea cynaroides]|uniref:Uncharacterized protein n=1 Tax=Protea cynaroides TaxID=273540 RepID=A0A9Q0KIT6_9MAGN|nr:hypothetical protein NE237_004369 [Protea cynaroides]